MYQYLAGVAIMACIWAVIFLLRKDLRRAMVWSGVLYTVFLSLGFIVYGIVSTDPARAITPGYWAPPTLFDLGQKTSGHSLEDALFMLFAGGIAVAIYPFIMRQKLGTPSLKRPGKKRLGLVLLAGVAAAFLFHYPFYLNDIYLLIVFNLVGALVVLWLRPDLVKQVFLGAVFFMAAYVTEFLLFNQIFPNFIDNYYNLGATAGVSPLGIPLEEYLYAITFGMLWGPLYMYAKGLAPAKQPATVRKTAQPRQAS